MRPRELALHVVRLHRGVVLRVAEKHGSGDDAPPRF